MCPRKTLRKKRDKGIIFLIISEQLSDVATLRVPISEIELSLFWNDYFLVFSKTLRYSVLIRFLRCTNYPFLLSLLFFKKGIIYKVRTILYFIY